MNFKTIITALCLLTCHMASKAQHNMVSVNHFTGTATAIVPIDQIVNGNVSVPVSLVYSSNGIKVKDEEGPVGLGWELNAGGRISRTVRGLPDDVKTSKGGIFTRLGWIYNTNGTKINNFNVSNDGSSGTCSDEQTDVNYINSNFNDNADTEPDIFNISAPGLSCRFAFDNGHIIRTIPYQDLQITYELDSNDQIKSFSVINDKGIRYSFAVTQQASTEATLKVTDYDNTYLPATNKRYFKRFYDQYFGTIVFNSSWLLSSITDANSNVVSFSYADNGTSTTRTAIELAINSDDKTTNYYVKETNQVNALISIQAPGHSIEFQYGVNGTSQDVVLKSMTSKGYKYLFNYEYVFFQVGQLSSSALCLRNVTTDQCNSPVNYYFKYQSETTSPVSTVGSYSQGLDSAYLYADAWGYPAGVRMGSSIQIADIPVDANVVMSKMLNQIRYYDGGTTDIVYESNNYLDPVTNSVVYGGGARVKQIIDHDGINATSNIVRNYNYLDPSTGQSSGYPLSIPKINFSNANGLVYATTDLTENDNSIVYSHVRESQTGMGSTLYEFTSPATYWDNSTPLGDWTPSLTYASRINCSTGIGAVSYGKNTYPFAPNSNYDLERGLIKQVTSYNETGNKVSGSVYTYDRSFAPVIINALRFDDNDDAKVYTKYDLITQTSELTVSVTKTVYEAPSFTPSHQSTTTLTYGSSAHKQLTQQETTNSDGSITRSNLAYTKDYNTGMGYNNYLLLLQQKHMNVPYETYTQVKQAGSSEFKTVNAEFTNFSTFQGLGTTANVLPSSTGKIVSVDGLSDFQPSGTGDARYVVMQSYDEYDKWGFLRHTSNINKQHQTVLRDSLFHQTIASFNNASPVEVTFNDFDNDTGNPNSFVKDISNWEYIIDRSGKHGLQLNSTSTLTRVIIKRSTEKNYVFSLWIKAGQAGSISYTLTGSSTQTLSYAATGNEWKYTEFKIPVNNISDYFSIIFQFGSGVAIDDVLLYPQSAEVSTFGYDHIGGYKIIETNTNGVSTYYTNDKFGRNKLIYDQNKNIVARKIYNFNNTDLTIPDPAFYINHPIGLDLLINSSYSFATYNSFEICQLPGATFSWNYGDGSSPTSSPQHTFSTAGTYEVALTVTVPGVGTRSATRSVVIKDPPPLMASIVLINNTTSSGLNKIVFLQNNVIVKTVLSNELGTLITPGNYTIKVYCYGNDIGISVASDSDSSQECQNWTHSNIYTYQVSLSSYLTIILNPNPCDNE